MSVHHPAVDVGTPPRTLCNHWETTEVRFHRFAEGGDERFRSPKFVCLGHYWNLTLWPCGYRGAHWQVDDGMPRADEGMTSIFLGHQGGRRTDNGIEFGFSVKDSDVNEVANVVPKSGIHYPYTRGTFNFAPRQSLLTALVNGTLVVEVRMRKSEPTVLPLLSPFIPKNPINKNILKLFGDDDSADVVFEVGFVEDGSTTSFHSHQLILRDGAITLAELCKQSSNSGGDNDCATLIIPITDVKPQVFEHMLYYTYGGKISDEELKENAKEIINACDKYGVVGLKLEAEASYVKTTPIGIDNMMDNLLYADSKNCALLKEAVIDFVVENGNNILGKVSFDNVPGGIVTDILTAITREKNKGANMDSIYEYQFNTMRVSELRTKLDEKGLDVDGSREAMIATLQESFQKKVDVEETA